MRFQSLSIGFALMGALLVASPSSGVAAPEPSRRVATDQFAIYSNTLIANHRTLIASDPTREINHAHLSPNRGQLTFTRYNVRNSQGVALETTSYMQTEILVCAADGSDCQVVIPSRPGIIAANASWTSDGHGLLFITNDTPSHHPGIALYDLATKRTIPFFQPNFLVVADPHMVGQTVVVTGLSPSDGISKIYLVSATGLRALTAPTFAKPVTLSPALGDFDPKLSPDGKKVAVMRHMAQDEWAIIVVDVATGKETTLSPAHSVDAVPEWSDNGWLLTFWHVDRANPSLSGVYTMRPDGRERTRILLPQGSFYTMPTFTPGGGALPVSTILYSARL